MQPQASLPVSDWNPSNLYGVNAPTRSMATVTPIPGIERSAGGGLFTAMGKAWHPDNPLFWVGVLILAGAGLIAGATEIRVGSARVGAGVGKP